jgi:hypothetical protein
MRPPLHFTRPGAAQDFLAPLLLLPPLFEPPLLEPLLLELLPPPPLLPSELFPPREAVDPLLPPLRELLLPPLFDPLFPLLLDPPDDDPPLLRADDDFDELPPLLLEPLLDLDPPDFDPLDLEPLDLEPLDDPPLFDALREVLPPLLDPLLRDEPPLLEVLPPRELPPLLLLEREPRVAAFAAAAPSAAPAAAPAAVVSGFLRRLVLRCSFKPRPALKATVVRSGMLISAPVRGFRPERAVRVRLVNFPNPGMDSDPAACTASEMAPPAVSKIASTTRAAAARVSSAFSATMSTKSDLFMGPLSGSAGSACAARPRPTGRLRNIGTARSKSYKGSAHNGQPATRG